MKCNILTGKYLHTGSRPKDCKWLWANCPYFHKFRFLQFHLCVIHPDLRKDQHTVSDEVMFNEYPASQRLVTVQLIYFF